MVATLACVLGREFTGAVATSAVLILGAAGLAVLIAWSACRVSGQCSRAEETTTFGELATGEHFQIDSPELTLTFRKLEGNNRALCLHNSGPATIHAGCPVIRVEGRK